MGIGIAVCVGNGSVDSSDLVHPLLRTIFEFTIKYVATKCAVLDREHIQCSPGIHTTGIDLYSLIFYLPSSLRYENFLMLLSFHL